MVELEIFITEIRACNRWPNQPPIQKERRGDSQGPILDKWTCFTPWADLRRILTNKRDQPIRCKINLHRRLRVSCMYMLTSHSVCLKREVSSTERRGPRTVDASDAHFRVVTTSRSVRMAEKAVIAAGKQLMEYLAESWGANPQKSHSPTKPVHSALAILLVMTVDYVWRGRNGCHVLVIHIVRRQDIYDQGSPKPALGLPPRSTKLGSSDATPRRFARTGMPSTTGGTCIRMGLTNALTNSKRRVS